MSAGTPSVDHDSLDDLLTTQQFAERHPKRFPNAESVRQMTRTFRAELTAAGALVQLGGRMLLHGEKAPRVLLEAGARAAARRVR